MDAKAISLNEVVAMVKMANKAFEENDFDGAMKINQELEHVGYCLVAKQGRLMLRNDTMTQAEPERAYNR